VEHLKNPLCRPRTDHACPQKLIPSSRETVPLNRRSNEAVRICLDEESAVLKMVLRVLYLGEASSRANSNPAAGQLMALLGKSEPELWIRDIFWCGSGSADPYTTDLRIRIPTQPPASSWPYWVRLSQSCGSVTFFGTDPDPRIRIPLTYMDPIDLPGGGQQQQPSRRPAHGPAG
jgi:hypothetical protein